MRSTRKLYTSNTADVTESFPPPPPPPPHPHRHHLAPHLIPVIAVVSAVFLVLLLALLVYLSRLLPHSRHKTAPSSPPSTTKNPQPSPPHPCRFTYDQLRVATCDFSPSLRLGQGGFGPVYRASLPSSSHPVAVKLMSSSSLQGDLEFRNELSLSSSLHPPSPSPILLPLGFCSHELPLSSVRTRRRRSKKRKKKGRTSRKNRTPDWFDAFDDGDDPQDNNSVFSFHDDDLEDGGGGAFVSKRLLLVYDLMENGSLQDALLVRRSPELIIWGRRFQIALDVAKGLLFLHVDCHPPVVHGDIKPSNILLDHGFRARIADFGLARVLEPSEIANGEVEAAPGREEGDNEEEEEEEEGASLSPELSPMRLEITTTMSGSEIGGGIDKASVESGGWRRTGSEVGKDWWWKQDLEEGKVDCGAGGAGGGRCGSSGGVKDYVMEWIGSEIRKERSPSNVWEAATSTASARGNDEATCSTRKKRQNRNRDWWSFGGEEHRNKRKKKPRRPREWWREEFCEELAKKSRKKQTTVSTPKSGICNLRGVIVSDKKWWHKQEEPRSSSPFSETPKKKNRSKNSSTIQHGMELRMPARRSSHDFPSGDIPKSGGVSSTPSMRGTVCYSAPECGGAASELTSEKCDIYSFGVLLLVIVSGRRPLQVTASPMSEFERANLISWARNLSRRGGNLLDLLDPSLHGVDKEQALLCVTVALLCLQRSPARRPNIKDVVEMLSGDLEPPRLPVEFSPSPPCSFPFKSRRRECR